MALTPFEVAETMLECVFLGVDPTIKRRCVVPGEIVWDACECGQLAITENRRYVSRAFPLEEVDSVAECGNPWLIVDYTVSLVRCVPVGVNGNPPTCDQLRTSALQLMKDKTDVRAALDCCLFSLYGDSDTGVVAYQVGAQETVGPQGACAGSETQVLVGFLNPCGC